MSLKNEAGKTFEHLRRNEINSYRELPKHVVKHGDPVAQAPPPRDVPQVIPAAGGMFKPIRSGGTDAALASLFQTMMFNLRINPNQWNLYMRSYVTDPKNGIPNNNKDQSSAKGNLSKELLKNRMTWKVFCKGLRFINRPKFRIIIEFPDSSGNYPPLVKEQHGINVNLGTALNIPGEKES